MLVGWAVWVSIAARMQPPLAKQRAGRREDCVFGFRRAWRKTCTGNGF